MRMLLAGFCAALVAAGSSAPAVLSQEASISKSKFPVALVKQLQSERKKRNLLVSPYSITSALAMTFNGARGETRKEMAEVLGFGRASDRDVNSEQKKTIKQLSGVSGGTKLEIANALFGRKGVDFKKKFLDTNNEFYNAGLQTLDFASSQAIETINSWVSDKTHNKINKIVDRITNDTLLYLINAVYFKGTWAHEFKKTSTQEEDFNLLSGEKKKVRMMHMSRSDFKYFDNDEFQAIKLFYKDRRLSLSVFLPRENSSLSAFESKFTKENWNKWKSKFARREGHIGLLRFNITDKLELNDTLSAMGMPLAFNPAKADFKNMANCNENIYIGSVLHKTFMEVNEKGTEAAAVTAVTMRATSIMIPQEKPFRMIVNRPFFFVLHDSQTDTILFMGHVVAPES